MQKHVGVVLVVLFVLQCTLGSPCVCDPFGAAQAYNLFSLGDVVAANSDVEGRVAANGDVTLASYSIGLTETDTVDYSLIASGHIQWTQGSVWHGGITGGSLDINNVGIMVGGEHFPSGTCCVDDSCTACNADATVSSPVDFLAADLYLHDVSDFWGSWATTDGATIELNYQALTLTCSDEDLNVFSGVNIDGVTSLSIVCSDSQTVLINYAAETSSFSAMGVDMVGTDSSKVIHHFTGPNVFMTGIGVRGTVFAPSTTLQLTGAIIHGPVIVGSFQAFSEENSNNDGQINRVPFTGCIPIPTPANVCCVYAKDSFENAFCSAGPLCEPISGWTVTESSYVQDCAECCRC